MADLTDCGISNPKDHSKGDWPKHAKQLQMDQDDMNHLILHPSELHIVMAQLCFIGGYIEISSIAYSWTEADLYGNASVIQIIVGNQVKRGIEAHNTTLPAPFTMCQEAFLRSIHTYLFIFRR